MIQDQPNLTAKEFFRMHGTLPAARIETLLDTETELASAKSIKPHIQEAMGQFPAEDFTSALAERLNTLVKRLRGDNKAELQACIEALDDIAQTTFTAADYGRDELRQAIVNL